MLYRNIREIATGQWVDVLFTTEAEQFDVKAISHRADIAAALGVGRTTLEVMDSSSDQRTRVLLEMPSPVETSSLAEQYGAAATDSERIGILAAVLGLAG
ncbi:MAG: hypothetical protein FI717_06345 [SAR202 cluster bacterium]|nr:hypothetical protein [SAR202 cluster bacterium]